VNFDIYGSNIRSLHKLTLILAATCLIMCGALVVTLIHANSIKERVVIVPPGLSGPVSVDWGKADSEYIKTFGLFYSTLVGSINPRNVEYVADRLSAMTSTAAYPQIRRSLLMLAKDPLFMDQATSSNFVSQALVYEAERNKVFVVGEVRVQGSVGQAKIFPTVYELKITIEEGKPIVHSVDNYPGSDPRTSKWLSENVGWDKKETESFK
jgi:conjugal transfer pilus assembly protein TraE